MACVFATTSVAARCAAPTKVQGQAARSVPLGKAAPSEWARKTVQNGMKVRAFQVWRPTNNKYAPVLLLSEFCALYGVLGRRDVEDLLIIKL
jgi:hypothetical protein